MSFPEEWGLADDLTRRETIDFDIDYVSQELVIVGCVWWKNETKHRTEGKTGIRFHVPFSDDARKVAIAIKRIQGFMNKNCPSPVDELVPEGAPIPITCLDDTLELVG